MPSIKFAIWTVYTLIVVTFAAKLGISIHNHTTLSPLEYAELGASAFVILALPIPAIARAFRSIASKFRSTSRPNDPVADLKYDFDDLRNDVRALQDDVEEMADNIRDLKADDLDHRYIPVIAETDPDTGKAVPLYELPPVLNREVALYDAKASLLARRREGQPVNNPIVILKDAFVPDLDD